MAINLLAPGGATATGRVPDDVPEGMELLDPEIIVPAAVHLALTHTSGERILATECRPDPIPGPSRISVRIHRPTRW